ncbi:MAG: gas vesicle protein K [Candidatus Koribacter versatilis]|uniref:Gas vesicle protein K n=1 Tax=Candidatus Korobacter versatilis TaxID=658062 RepID=A0A932ENA7_9BACT|nr:gas vesicle protein K [Candidatus Koribacter versatilis]
MSENDKPRQLSADEVTAAVTDLKRQLETVAHGTTERIDCTSETLEQGLAKLVLGLMELLRRLLERQAVRRMEGGSLSDRQVEEMGQALMKLEQKIGELCQQFGLRPEDLNLGIAVGDLGAGEPGKPPDHK